MVTTLSLAYRALVRELSDPLTPAHVGQVLLDAAATHYRGEWADCCMVEFTVQNATYVYDAAGASGDGREERTVWGARTPHSYADLR